MSARDHAHMFSPIIPSFARAIKAEAHCISLMQIIKLADSNSLRLMEPSSDEFNVGFLIVNDLSHSQVSIGFHISDWLGILIIRLQRPKLVNDSGKNKRILQGPQKAVLTPICVSLTRATRSPLRSMARVVAPFGDLLRAFRFLGHRADRCQSPSF